MTIRITRNAAGNCLNFIGSSHPAYFNACLSGQVDPDDSTKVNIVNDIQTQNNPNGEIRYEFYQIPFTEFADKDGNLFANAQEAADYITQEGNVMGVSDVGTDLTGVTVNFRLDQTNTSVIMDNGAAFGVNTIKAVPGDDGLIAIHAIGAGVPEDSSEPDDHKHYEKLDHTMVQINGSSVTGGLNDVCNRLNELFTVGAWDTVVINDPYSTMVADVNGTETTGEVLGVNGLDPAGYDIFGADVNGHRNGYKTTEKISKPGEYFTFNIRNEGTIGFGLIHSDGSYSAGKYTGNSSYADPSQFAVGNSQHYGFQFSHWFHQTPNGSWTNYGANTGYSMREAWYNSNTHFEARDKWLDGQPITIRVGLDDNGMISVWSLGDPVVSYAANSEGDLTSGSILGVNGIDPLGDDIFAANVNGHKNGYKTSETISKPGEYFTFRIRNEGTIGFGLVHSDASYAAGHYDGNATYADPSQFAVGNSQHSGFQFSHWFHPTPNGSWTNYGANTSMSIRSGWYSQNFEAQDEWLAGEPITVRVGLDDNGMISIWTLKDDETTWSQHVRTTYPMPEGSEFHLGIKMGDTIVRLYDQPKVHLMESDAPTTYLNWKQHVRTSYPVPEGAEFHLGVKMGDTTVRLYDQPKVHLVESEAPTMNFRYIESPDGNFEYPLFATEEEANYYDLNHDGTTGAGTSHQHVYVDDPTGTTWYMPDTGRIMNGATPPQDVAHTVFMGSLVSFTEITSLTDADLSPPAFSGPDYTFSEGATVAIQVSPQDVSYTTTVSGLPAELSFTGGFAIQGTTRHVYGDVTHTITVTRTNSYGSSQGTFDITVTDDVAQNAISGYTIYGQNPITQSPDIIHHYSGAVNLDLNETLDPGTELIWTQQNGSPVGGSGQYVQIGIADPGIDKMTTQLGNNTQDWQVKATIWTSSLNHNFSTGWTNSGSDSYSTNDSVEWRLAFPSDAGPIELYRDDVLVRTSSASFSGPQAVTVGVPVAYTTTTRVPSVTKADIAFAGDPPSGFTQEFGTMNSSTTLSPDSVVNLDQSLPVGKRLVVNKSWIEANVLPYCTVDTQKAFIGVPSSLASWGSVDLHNDFDAVMRWEGQTSGASHKSTLADGSDSVARHESNVGSASNAHYHYAIEWDGTNLTVLADTDISKFTTEGSKYNFSRYSCYENYTEQSGSLPLVMATKTGGTMTLTMNGISVVDIPVASGGQNDVGIPYTPNYTFSGTSHFTSSENYSAGDEAYDNMGIDEIGISGSFLSINFKGSSSMSDFRNGSYTVNITADNGTDPSWEGLYNLDSSSEYSVSSTHNYVLYNLQSQAGGSAVWSDLAEYAAGGNGINLVDLEFEGSAGLTTPWTKALDFSGGNEHAITVNSSQSCNPTRLSSAVTHSTFPATGQTISSGRPWATAIVFSSDRHNSNQHIWNQGEGSGSNDDNIYVRQSSTGNLYFGWGRDGSLNECHITGALGQGEWYGLYVAHNGTRLDANDSTAANLAEAFDIRLYDGTGGVWDMIVSSMTDGSGQRSTTANWSSQFSTTGGYMGRSVDGYFSIGGRRSNRSFHGKVASMVRTTLLNGVSMPDLTEVELMIIDPLAWKNTYKAGNQFRQPQTDTGTSTWDNANATTKGRATQIWLMGDGGNDSYSNMIRNRINSSDQNDNKLNLISMVSGDIQSVNINGLTS